MRSLFVLLAVVRLAAAADSSLGAYFPPDTKAVVGVHVRSIIDNPLFADAIAEVRTKSAAILTQTPLAGFDPLKDLDEILFATSGKGEKPPAIAVLLGRFPVEQLGQDARRYREVPILQSPKQPQGALALIDSSTAIAGPAADVRAAIDRRAEATSGLTALMSRVDTLRSRYSIWGFGDGIETAARGKRPGDFSSIDRFEFGVALDRGLRINAQIHVRTPQDFEKMAATIRMVEAMINAAKAKKPANDTSVELSAAKGILKFSLTVPEAEMKKAMMEERDSLVAALSSRLPALLGPAPRPNPAVPPGQAFTIEQGAGISSEAKTVTNSKGDTVILTLPGK
jgi:hypothetical protein